MTKMFFNRGDDKSRYGLYPSHQTALDYVMKMPLMKDVIFDVTSPRNIKALRKYWLMCDRVAENLNADFDSKVVDHILKLRSGNFRVIKTIYGDEKMAGSISVPNMPDNADFSAFFDRAITIICRDLIPGLEETEARKELLDIVSI